MTTLAWAVFSLLVLRYFPVLLVALIDCAADVRTACRAFERAMEGHDERLSNIIRFPTGGRSAWRRNR